MNTRDDNGTSTSVTVLKPKGGSGPPRKGGELDIGRMMRTFLAPFEVAAEVRTWRSHEKTPSPSAVSRAVAVLDAALNTPATDLEMRLLVGAALDGFSRQPGEGSGTA